MKRSSRDKQLGLASPLESATSRSGQTLTLARMRGLDASHHTRISPRGGEKSFFLTSSFIRMSEMAIYRRHQLSSCSVCTELSHLAELACGFGNQAQLQSGV